MLTSTFLRWTDRLYSLFTKTGSNLQSLFLLYMRLTWGHQLFLGGTNLFETVLGALLFIGFASRIIAIPLIILMLVTLSTVHAEALSGFQFVLNPHSVVILRPYPFLITALMVFVFGPGRISVDAWIKHWVAKQPRY